MSYINAIRENKILAKISEFTVHHLQEIYYQKPHENINSPAPNKYKGFGNWNIYVIPYGCANSESLFNQHWWFNLEM